MGMILERSTADIFSLPSCLAIVENHGRSLPAKGFSLCLPNHVDHWLLVSFVTHYESERRTWRTWFVYYIWGFAYRKNSNDGPTCYVVGVASSGKVCVFFTSLRGAEPLTFCCVFHPFSRVGNFRRHSTWAGCLCFCGILPAMSCVQSGREMGIPGEWELEFCCCFSISGWIPEITQVLIISLTSLERGTLRCEDCCIFLYKPYAPP